MHKKLKASVIVGVMIVFFNRSYAASDLDNAKERCRQYSDGSRMAQCYSDLISQLCATASVPAALCSSVTAQPVEHIREPGKSRRNTDGSKLDTLWPSSDDNSNSKEPYGPKAFIEYKPTYLLLSETHQQNSTPNSPKEDHVVPAHYSFDPKELKFQISFKTQFLYPSSDTHSVWLAYTQQSHWQIFDGAHSRRFRTNDYEPELIYSYHFNADTQPFVGLQARFLNIGYVHQSNGESNPYSRSWNRIYAQLGVEHVFSSDRSLVVLLRPWLRVHENYASDDNPDITKYLGFGELELRYWWSDQFSASLLARKRSAQLDVTFPLNSKERLEGHLQYFNGYGESLIDYNQRHRTIGIGISLPFPGK